MARIKKSASSRDKLSTLVNSVKMSMDLPSKLKYLRLFSQDLLENGVIFQPEFLPRLFDLLSDQLPPVRKLVTEIIGNIGQKHVEYLPEIVPVLINVLKDDTPAVARQAITCGTDLFRFTLRKVVLQGLHTSGLDDDLESSWKWMLKFKDDLFSIAFLPGSGGVRLLALKFVETVILLYTHDPNGSSEPSHEGNALEFNISWLRKGNPVLNAGDLSIEAGRILVKLLEQLRSPGIKSPNSSVVIVLINSLSVIAKQRPTYYGRILPVLLGLDPPSLVIKGVRISAARHALKNVFISCLKCTHPAAAPWRDRLTGALRDMEIGGSADQLIHQACKTNGSIEIKEELPITEEENPLVTGSYGEPSNSGKKRCGDSGDLPRGHDVSGKRARTAPSSTKNSSKELNTNVSVVQPCEETPSTLSTANKGQSDAGTVQQVVAMFGALVAQGEKAFGSIEILITSISAELLAELVMANMRNLPSNSPEAEGDAESVLDMSIIGSDTQVKYPPSFLAGVLSLSTTFPSIASSMDSHPPVSADIDVIVSLPPSLSQTTMLEEEDQGDGSAGIPYEAEDSVLPSDLPYSDAIFSVKEEGNWAIPAEMHEEVNLESEIPGLDSSARQDRLSETLITSPLASTDVKDVNQHQVMSLIGGSSMDMITSLSTDRSEELELSPKATTVDSNNLVFSTATSVGVSSALILPKISATILDLTDEQKDNLQKMSYMRIVEAYKQVTLSGGSQVCFSLLANLGVEFPLELDQWKLLQEHILSDYINHEGHELTVRVLYRLYGEAEEEHDFFSSTTAASVYEAFLLAVAEALRDSFPPSDKSLSRLLGDAPYLPKSVLKLLECLCCPGNSNKSEKEMQSGDRVTQGLSTLWNLILQRPSIRDVCLSIALQTAVHHMEEARMKAIRLVANKLYPLPSLTQQIEIFARDNLFSIINQGTSTPNIDGTIADNKEDPDSEKLSNEHQAASEISKTDRNQSLTCCSDSFSEAQRCMSLFFALCTKKHSLFRQIFVVYKDASSAVRQAVHRHIPILVRTMGSSSELLEIVSDPPSGSENLLMQVLQTLTDGAVPSSELIFTIRKLFDTKVKDVEIMFPVLPFLSRDELVSGDISFLLNPTHYSEIQSIWSLLHCLMNLTLGSCSKGEHVPVLPFLSRDEVLRIFPHLVSLSLDKFQVALNRMLQGTSHSGPLLSPAEVLIAIHGIDPERDGIPLKKVTDACNVCFEQRDIFTQPVLAKVLNQLVEQIPLPLLFMRTVLQAINYFPALVDFIMEILSRLVNKQIWKHPKLWVGFLKCAQSTMPHSFKVLLQLPPPQLENALNRVAALRAPLVSHANQPDIKSTLPRSALVVLGLALESQPSNQAQTIQPQTSQAQTSTSHPLTSQAQASQSQTGQAQASQSQTSQAQASLSQTSQAQASVSQTSEAQPSESQTSEAQPSESQTSQGQPSQSQTSQGQPNQSQISQAQASQSQTGDTVNLETDAGTERSKESSTAG